MKIPIAADFMHRDMACARPDQTLDELASFLTEEDVHGAPVVSDEGALMGIVSRSDVVRAMAEANEDEQPQAANPEGGETGLVDVADDSALNPTPAPQVVVTAREIMSTQVVTAGPQATPGTIAELMSTNKIQRVVILDSGRVAGLVSISDLLPLIAGYEKSLVRANAPAPRAAAAARKPARAQKAARPQKAAAPKPAAKASARRGASKARKVASGKKATKVKLAAATKGRAGKGRK